MSELVYADDTPIFDTQAQHAKNYMNCIKAIAAEYGLSSNVGKLEALPVRTSAAISSGYSGVMKNNNSIRYLGCLISNIVRMSSELGARIGAATSDFKTLRRIWGTLLAPVCQASSNFLGLRREPPPICLAFQSVERR